jgi:transketolase
MTRTDEICVNTLRFLAVDAIEKARSGHPGLPLGAAPIAYVLWDRFLKHNPENPSWANRDRFVLSAGHGSALLYALLHMTGYDVSLEDIRQFRQWESRTPGHPEYRLTPGVEATTGPLGQGFAMSVGMAMAEHYLSAHFNREGYPVIDHFTYALVSDGDLMEGVSHEAASLAGHLGLGKLVCLYDDNDVSIEGSTDITFTEDVGARFEAYHWHVEQVGDANDLDAVDEAIRKALAESRRPSIIIIRSHLGYGSPKQDKASAHGEPLGPEAARATKAELGWPLEPAFHVPEEARAHLGLALERGRKHEVDWRQLLVAYREGHPDLADLFQTVMDGRLPEGWEATIPSFDEDDGPLATRGASGRIINSMAGSLPNLIGGSADLAPSNKTHLEGYDDFGSDSGRNVHFGVREFAACAAANGMALHGGIIPYGATFLVFSDYMRPAIRLAGLMNTHIILVFSHDSIALGEDGPTHQPVEQMMSLRMIPNLTVLRPADANETAACWKIAIQAKGPVAMLLSRQKLPVLSPDRYPVDRGTRRGGYALRDPETGRPDIVLIATGSEVHLALDAAGTLEARGLAVRVVSLPSWEVFEQQSREYKDGVLPTGIPRIAIEAGVTSGWERYTGSRDAIVGLDEFGVSAPGGIAYAELGFNVQKVIEAATKATRR